VDTSLSSGFNVFLSHTIPGLSGFRVDAGYTRGAANGGGAPGLSARRLVRRLMYIFNLSLTRWHELLIN
jgi:hypothetical protein